MSKPIIDNYLSETLRSFGNYKNLSDKSLAQVSDDDFFRVLGAEDNSIAVIVKHLAGNFRSRWSDFFTTDGEKQDRNRDAEFVTLDNETRESLLESWESGWTILLTSVESLTADDLTKTVTIRGEAHTVVEALNRALAHCAYHTGQIVLLAKHFCSNDWQSLSIPRNKSNAFNEFLKVRSENNLEAHNYFDAPSEFNSK